MGPMRKTTNEMRSKACRFFSLGLSYSRIASLLGLSKTTIMRIIKRNGLKREALASGRHRILSQRAIRLILNGIENGEFRNCTSAKKYIGSALNAQVSAETIRRIATKNNYKSYARPTKPRLTMHHKKNRYRFAQDFFDAPTYFWDYVIFTDESKFNLYGPDGNRRVWRRPGSGVKDWQINKRVKFGGGGVMVWSAITRRGVGRLVFIEGKMDSGMFISILGTGYASTIEMHGYRSDEVFLQMDNDPKHASRATKNWLFRNGIKTLPWPSCSPDMNIIEHVWNDVNIRLRARPSQPKNIHELKTAVEEEWYATSPASIEALYRSMGRRVEALLASKGGYTKY